MFSLSKQQKIGNYFVAFPIKQGSYAETYRVKDSSGKNYFLKLVAYNKLHQTQFDENGDCLELKISEQLNHPNLLHYRDGGETLVDGKRMLYMVYDFISGETVAQKVARDKGYTVYDTKHVVLGVLEGLNYLHSLANPIIHNELTPQNVMLDMSKGLAKPIIIDFGYARFMSQNHRMFQKEGLDLYYQAPEALNGVFSPQSDIFSVGAMMYQLLFGKPPFYVNLSKFQGDRISLIDVVNNERKKPLRILDRVKVGIDDQLINIMAKALAYSADARFQTVQEFSEALKGDFVVSPAATSQTNDVVKETNTCDLTIPQGDGFKDVAGMTALKEQLQSDVIELIKNPDQAKELGLSMPNGILFYGPPGCGKTFFAEKFAEEAGFNYKYIKCSDVASPYIHGGQDKIAAIFEDARKNAPTILFFDEIDAMIKDRSMHNNVSEAGEVNEFLAQLNNCGESGVLVIGATNKPGDIDEAALRAGRLEFKYYIPQPDAETRASIFEINLSKRKCDFGIDYEKLASLTENYISADIKMIVDNAARLTFRRKLGKILQSTLEEVIAESKPSITMDIIKKHEAIRDEFSGKNKQPERRKIGF